MRTLLVVLVLALALAAPALAGAASAGDRPVLRAHAGLDGLCKPGRWMPVRVEIDTAGTDIMGDLLVDWGTVRVRRAVTLPAPSRRLIELYIRTADVRDAITVSLSTQGREVGTVTVPVRFAPADQPLTVCVAPASGPPLSRGGCAAIVAAGSLPRSWRGYDAADQVDGALGNEAALEPDQARALSQWRAFHPLDAPGNLPGPGMPAPFPGRSGPLPRLLLASYLVGLAVAGLGLRAAHSRGITVVAVLAALAATGAAGAAAAGRVGPFCAVQVRHESVIQQFAGAAGSLVWMKGRVEYPAFDAFELRPAMTDAVIDPLPAPVDRPEQQFDARGVPVLAGVHGLASGQQFELEGVADFAVLQETTSGSTIRIVNTGRADLQACSFSAAFSRQSVGELRAGDHVEAEYVGHADAPTFSCLVPASLFDFSDPRRRVDSRGRARLVYHPRPAGQTP